MTDSARPAGSRSIIADSSGMRVALPWKGWAAALGAIITFTGGYAGFRLVTCDQMQAAITASETKQKTQRAALAKTVSRNTSGFVGLTATVGQIQQTQHMDIAIREARRVVDEAIICRRNDQACLDKRDEARERIRRMNMKRLAAKDENGQPHEPCSDLTCK